MVIEVAEIIIMKIRDERDTAPVYNLHLRYCANLHLIEYLCVYIYVYYDAHNSHAFRIIYMRKLQLRFDYKRGGNNNFVNIGPRAS